MLANIAALLLSAGIAHALPRGNENNSSSKGLKWKDCTDDFFPNTTIPASQKGNVDCATLEVPLDYTDPNSEPLELQLVRNKATKGPFLGSVLINPGGPGESGLALVASRGQVINSVLGGQFDIIGFDPRGVGNTIPFKCPAPSTGDSATLHRRDNITWDSNEAVAKGCYEANKKTGRFLSTAFVARDMLEIVDALDEDGLLRYWGFSYGTTLGQTFGAMFPDRIDRMILDSVQLAPDYYTGYSLTAALDVNRALTHGFSQCIELGSEICPLAALADTAEGLMSKFGVILEGLIDNLSVGNNAAVYSALRGTLFTLLYTPGQLVQALKLVELAFAGDEAGILKYQQSLPASGVEATEDYALYGITCIDNTFRANRPEDLYGLTAAWSERMPFPDITLAPNLCAQWKFDAAERYSGKFENITTSHPVMFINGPYDPITAMSNAYVASVIFRDSRVLEYKGLGHAASISHPSKCTNKAVREYFVNGNLPELGAQCEPDTNAVKYGLALLDQKSV